MSLSNISSLTLSSETCLYRNNVGMVTFFFGFAVSIAVSLTINNIFLYSRQGVRSTNIKNILKPDLLVYITQLVGATFLLIHLLLKFYQFAFVQNNGYKDNCYSIKWSVFLTAPVFVMAMNVILIWRISILLPSRFQLAAKVALTLAQLVSVLFGISGTAVAIGKPSLCTWRVNRPLDQTSKAFQTLVYACLLGCFVVPFRRLSKTGIMSTNIVRASRIVILQIAVPIIIFSIGIFITPALIGSSNMEILFMTQEICIFAAMSLTYKIGSQSQVSSQILTVSTNSIRSYGKSSYVNGRGKDHSGSDAMILKATSPVLLLKLPVSDRVHVRSVMDVPTIDYSLNGIESFELE